MSVLPSPRDHHRRRTARRAQALRSVARTRCGGSPGWTGRCKPWTPQGSSLRSTAIAGTPEAPLALPTVSRSVEKRVLGHLDPLALLVDTLVASLTLPAIPRGPEIRVLGHLDPLALLLDTLVAPVALPVIYGVDVGMVRHGSGVFRPAEGWEQTDPQREEEAKNGPGSNCLRIANVHESSGRWRCGCAKSLLWG